MSFGRFKLIQLYTSLCFPGTFTIAQPDQVDKLPSHKMVKKGFVIDFYGQVSFK